MCHMYVATTLQQFPTPRKKSCIIISNPAYEIFEGEKFRVSVQDENSAENTFADCSVTSNYYVGVATKFCGENFRGCF